MWRLVPRQRHPPSLRSFDGVAKSPPPLCNPSLHVLNESFQKSSSVDCQKTNSRCGGFVEAMFRGDWLFLQIRYLLTFHKCQTGNKNDRVMRSRFFSSERAPTN